MFLKSHDVYIYTGTYFGWLDFLLGCTGWLVPCLRLLCTALWSLQIFVVQNPKQNSSNMIALSTLTSWTFTTSCHYYSRCIQSHLSEVPLLFHAGCDMTPGMAYVASHIKFHITNMSRAIEIEAFHKWLVCHWKWESVNFHTISC